MQTHENFQPYTVKQNHSQKVELIESSLKPNSITQAPINGGTDFQGELLLIPIFLFGLAFVLNCLENSNLHKNFRNRLDTLKYYHQIPCSNCHFFKTNIYLKCAVHPSTVLTAKAINCPDYCFKYSNNNSRSHNL